MNTYSCDLELAEQHSAVMTHFENDADSRLQLQPTPSEVLPLGLIADEL